MAKHQPTPKLRVPTFGRRSERSRTPFRRSPFGTVAERSSHSGTAVTLVERALRQLRRLLNLRVTPYTKKTQSTMPTQTEVCNSISDPYSRTTLTLRTTAQSAVQQNNTYTYIAHYTRPCMASHAHASIPTAAAASFAVAALFSASKVKQGQQGGLQKRGYADPRSATTKSGPHES